jgi:putative tricarboxylic transport membrane protein
MPDPRRGREGRVAGGMLVLLGILSLWEGWRLYALRTQMVAGAVVGDDTFPFIVGAALLLLGASILFVVKPPLVKVARPSGEPRTRMILGAGVLAAYWIIVPYLGYTGSTALVSTGLFRAMGGYRWPFALLLGGATTGLLYLLFRVWLLQPLPTGLLGL